MPARTRDRLALAATVATLALAACEDAFLVSPAPGGSARLAVVTRIAPAWTKAALPADGLRIRVSADTVVLDTVFDLDLTEPETRVRVQVPNVRDQRGYLVNVQLRRNQDVLLEGETTVLLVAGQNATAQVSLAPAITEAEYRTSLDRLYEELGMNQTLVGLDVAFSQYLRLLWQMQELPTDEAILGWGDAGIADMNAQTWSASSPFALGMYRRIYDQIALANAFLLETSDAKLADRSPALRTQVAQYRPEARFLRALSYWHGIDLFGDIPLIDENMPADTLLPQTPRSQVFAFLVNELTGIRAQLPASNPNSRARRVAASMLLAKLYLNAAVYSGTPRYAEALTATEDVILSGVSLDASQPNLFLADNHLSPELIFAVPQDGLNTQSWGISTFLVHAAIGGSMNPGAYGVDSGWWGIRLRPEAYLRYGPGDVRAASFYVNGPIDISNVADFTQGVAAPKFRNLTRSGQPGSNLTHVDIDYPMFRLGDAYLMYAEAVLRGGGGNLQQALAYVNALRARALVPVINASQLTLDFILEERSRELLWEGHRRTDLIRFDRFTTSTVWSWKGGVQAGQTTGAFRALYPIPADELLANPSLKQNPGY